MSVIAKLLIRSTTQFGTGQFVELGCVCENDLMASTATTEEDKLFTRYSPSGTIRLNQPSGYSLGDAGDEFVQGSAYYVMVLTGAEVEDKAFPGAYAVCPARCVSLTNFGDNQAQIVEFRNSGPHDAHRGVDRLNWKMSVDNPLATNQFKPGSEAYWIAIYPADKFTRDSAIRAAHGHPEPAAA